MNSFSLIACTLAAVLCHSLVAADRRSYVQPSRLSAVGFKSWAGSTKCNRNHCSCNCGVGVVCCAEQCCTPNYVQPGSQYPVPPQTYVQAPSPTPQVLPCCNFTVEIIPGSTNYPLAPTCVPCTTTTPATTTAAPAPPCTTETPVTTTTAQPCNLTPATTQPTPDTYATTPATLPPTTETVTPEMTTARPIQTTEVTTATPPTCPCTQVTTTTTASPSTTVGPCTCPPKPTPSECNCENCECNKCKCKECTQENCNCKECAIYFPTVIIVRNPVPMCYLEVKETRKIQVFCNCLLAEGSTVSEASARCTATEIDVSYYREISLFFPGTYVCDNFIQRFVSIEQRIQQVCNVQIQPTQPAVVPPQGEYAVPNVPVNPGQAYPVPEVVISTNQPEPVDNYNVATTTVSSSSSSVVSWISLSVSLMSLTITLVFV